MVNSVHYNSFIELTTTGGNMEKEDLEIAKLKLEILKLITTIPLTLILIIIAIDKLGSI